jgi:hypothetical protein
MKTINFNSLSNNEKEQIMKQEIDDLKKMVESIRKEKNSLEREVEKYKVQLDSHVKYEKRLLELINEYETDSSITYIRPEADAGDRSIDDLTDDEINQLIEQNRKLKP